MKVQAPFGLPNLPQNLAQKPAAKNVPEAQRLSTRSKRRTPRLLAGLPTALRGLFSGASRRLDQARHARRSAWQRKRCATRIYYLVPHPHDAPGTTHAWAEASEFADAPAANAAFAAPVKIAKKKMYRDAIDRCAVPQVRSPHRRARRLAAELVEWKHVPNEQTLVVPCG